MNIPEVADGVFCPNGPLAGPPRFIFSVEVTFATVGELESFYLHDYSEKVFNTFYNQLLTASSSLASLNAIPALVGGTKFILASVTTTQ
jgi:hypothetical protein